MAFFKLFGAVCRCCSAKYRELWLVCERGNDARDNGYWFYRYLKEKHPEINARYVIETDSADRAKIEALGGMVPRGSFSHYLAYYCADFLVGTHVQPCAPDLILFYHLAGKGIRARGKQVFLQHGIIKDEMEWLHRKNMYMDLFVCGAKPEYEYIRDTFGYPEHVPQYVGLARFDNLIRAERKEKMILVMPTWRGSHYPTGEAFRKTAYYEHFQSLLCCKELEQLLEQQDYRLVFYPHIEMQKDSRRFKSGSDRITIVSKETHDVQKLLMDCALLVRKIPILAVLCYVILLKHINKLWKRRCNPHTLFIFYALVTLFECFFDNHSEVVLFLLVFSLVKIHKHGYKRSLTVCCEQSNNLILNGLNTTVYFFAKSLLNDIVDFLFCGMNT